jgi:hypothetical protein
MRSTKRFYVLAEQHTECIGQGDYIRNWLLAVPKVFETKELAERFKKENEGKIEYYRLPFSSVVALEMDNE